MPIIFFLLFVLLPIAELYVIIKVGGAIGILPTLGLIFLTGAVGAMLASSQGRNVWRRFNEALRAGKVPAREVLDGAMIIFGGALLLSPGFITDVLGISLLFPPTRAIVRRLLKGAAARTPQGRPVFFVYDRFGTRRGSAAGGPAAGGRPGGPGPGGPGGSAGGGYGGGPATGPSPWDRPAGQGAPSRSYDVEGTAREIGDEQFELPGTPASAPAERGPGNEPGPGGRRDDAGEESDEGEAAR